MQSVSLLDRTRELLINRPKPLTFDHIEAAVPDLSKRWLSGFANGKIESPSVVKVQALYEYLTDKPLLVD